MEFDPNDIRTFVSFKGVNRDAIEANQLQKKHNEELRKQNELLAKIAIDAKLSAKSSEESAKHSKICTVISLIVAILMLIVTAIGVYFQIKTSNKQDTQEQTEQTQLLPQPICRLK